MTLAPVQLQFDFAELAIRADLRDRRRAANGAERLLITLVERGLDDRALPVAAALVAALDEPKGAT